MKIQQGDVIIRKSAIPEDARKYLRGRRGFVLAEGEVTGHAHVISDDIEMYEKNGTLFIRNKKEVPVKHEEHNTVTVPAGEWEIRIVREYDPFEEEARKVAD